VEKSPKSGPSNEFYLIGFHGSHEWEIDPLELLQAYSQEGIVCYFSALAHLELTTQVPVHHHIAIPTRKPHNMSKETAEPVTPMNTSGETTIRSKLGTHIFTYEGIPYYSTKRAINSIPGIKERIFSQWSTIRMTTVEQTLLDTLQYPYHCGGPEVVFEAWHRAQYRYEEKDLLEDLKTIGLPPLIRRLGAIYKLFCYVPSEPLGAFLNEKRSEFFKQVEIPPIPILRGLTFSQLDPDWNVLVP